MTVSTNPTNGTREGAPLRTSLVWLLAAILLVILPIVFSSGGAITVMNQMAITIVFALAYNMLLGQGGMLSFGHAVYMGLGGVFAMHVLNWSVFHGLTLPLPLLPLFGGFFGLVFAFVIGAFSTRRAGTVFAMISLGVGELVAAVSIIFVAFFGGEEGVSGDRTSGPEIFGIDFAQQSEVYGLIAGWMFLSALAMYLFSKTPMGSMANAVRDNPQRAEFLGYSTRNVRWVSFCVSGFFCGIAGALFAINYEILTAENLDLNTSGSILLITFLGGVGFFIGPIIGAVVFTLLSTVVSLQTELWQLYVGLLFVITVMFFPNGLTGLLAMHGTTWRNGSWVLLAWPYLKCFVPGSLSAIASITLLEMLHHVRRAAPGDGEFSALGFAVNTSSAWPYASALGVIGLSLPLLRRSLPAVREAWQSANAIQRKSIR